MRTSGFGRHGCLMPTTAMLRNCQLSYERVFYETLRNRQATRSCRKLFNAFSPDDVTSRGIASRGRASTRKNLRREVDMAPKKMHITNDTSRTIGQRNRHPSTNSKGRMPCTRILAAYFPKIARVGVCVRQCVTCRQYSLQ